MSKHMAYVSLEQVERIELRVSRCTETLQAVQVPKGTLVVVRIDGYQGYFKFDGPTSTGMIPGQDLDGGDFFLAFQPTGDGALVAM